MKLRLKFANGACQVELADSATLQDLRDVILEKSEILHVDQEVKLGFPPKLLGEHAANAQLATIGILHGESLLVREVNGAGGADDPSAKGKEGDAVPEAALKKPKPAPKPTEPAKSSSEPAKTEAKSASSLPPSGYSNRTEAPKAPTSPKPSTTPKPAATPKEWPPARPKPASAAPISSMDRIVIPADNSCMFNAMAKCLRLTKKPDSVFDVPMDLRYVVSNQIKSEPGEWDIYTLGESDKTSLEYADWILNKEKWGGSIELNILSKYLKCQICTIDIKSAHPEFFPHEPIPGTDRTRIFTLVIDFLNFLEDSKVS